MLAIRYTKFSGMTFLSTASLKPIDPVESLGADEVIDHTKPDCGQNIRSYINITLRCVFDATSQAKG
ncbi:hypothetical protein BCON_0040g00400 [Botryotinia convoluta]|uniref:Alcohol dehydrogenase-like C-terminal domain-containing protein n=1 Tax=Botryotinia convoluta TaxID=54673 RepID=A0A4Z1ITG4_9HELO|nr:hypothetical protein BCON_0040g00400 [Botryotinia convoluta]